MSRVYVIAYVPAASRAAADAAVAGYEASANNPGVSSFAAPLSPTGAAPATHYGSCAAADDAGQLYAALPALKAAFPGGDYHTVPVASYDHAADWRGWLAARSLVPVNPVG